MSVEKKLFWYVSAVLFSLILTPALRPLGTGPAVRLDDILLLCAPFVVAWWCRGFVSDIRLILLSVIFLLIIFSSFWGAIHGYPAALGDLFSLFRWVKYVAVVLLVSSLLHVSKDPSFVVSKVSKISVVFGVGLAGIAFQQYFDFLSLNSLYVYDVAPTQYRTLVDDYPWPRPVGMVGNPNELGFVLALLGLVSIHLSLTEESKRVLWGFAALAILLAMSITLSRSAVFAFFIMGLVYVWSVTLPSRGVGGRWVLKRGGIIGGVSVVLCVLAVVLVGFFSPGAYESVVWRFSPEYFGSFDQRVINWSENLTLFYESPLFGVGLLRHSGAFVHAADNEWLMMARIGGLLVLVPFALLFLLPLFPKSVSNVRRRVWLARSISIGTIIYMIPAAAFYSLVIMPLLLILFVLYDPRPFRRFSQQATRNFG